MKNIEEFIRENVGSHLSVHLDFEQVHDTTGAGTHEPRYYACISSHRGLLVQADQAPDILGAVRNMDEFLKPGGAS